MIKLVRGDEQRYVEVRTHRGAEGPFVTWDWVAGGIDMHPSSWKRAGWSVEA